MDENFATAMQSGARELADQTDLLSVRLIRARGDRRRRRRAAGGVGLLLVSAAAVGVGIVRFNGNGQHGSVPTTTIPRTSENPDGKVTPTTTIPKVSETPTPEGTPPTTTSPPDCKTAQLKITYGQVDAGMSHLAQPLLFLNTGSTVCRLHGYPSVTVLDNLGHPIVQARQTPRGYMGGLTSSSTTPPTVDLDPGQSASAVMEAFASSATGPQCPAYNSILVTPPNETHPISLRWPLDRCSNLEVHPVVPGSTVGSG